MPGTQENYKESGKRKGKKIHNTGVWHLGDKGIMTSLLNSKSAVLKMPSTGPKYT